MTTGKESKEEGIDNQWGRRKAAGDQERHFKERDA